MKLNKEDIIREYGFDLKILNKGIHYQISREDTDLLFNWYPTSGKWFYQQRGTYGAVKKQEPEQDIENLLKKIGKIIYEQQ